MSIAGYEGERRCRKQIELLEKDVEKHIEMKLQPCITIVISLIDWLLQTLDYKTASVTWYTCKLVRDPLHNRDSPNDGAIIIRSHSILASISERWFAQLDA